MDTNPTLVAFFRTLQPGTLNLEPLNSGHKPYYLSSSSALRMISSSLSITSSGNGFFVYLLRLKFDIEYSKFTFTNIRTCFHL